MKEGATVILVGLIKATHLNGKAARVVGQDERGRWLVKVLDVDENLVGLRAVDFTNPLAPRC